MAFTLVMLGTDTFFTPKSKKEYVSGELLSVISTLIARKSDPSVYDDSWSKDIVSPYIADNVEVIIGPATLGKEVANRIQAGVSAILKAVARGETEINIIAHSRGAIEAILIAHQIDDIKNVYSQLQEQNDSTEVLGNVLLTLADKEHQGKFGNTGEIIVPLSRNDEFKNEDLFKINFQRLILNTNINLLGIDPVPGDFNFSGLFEWIEWIDSRFYKVPAIVKDCEIYLYENERSRAFTPVLPVAISGETTLQAIPILGHHGTGSSGNNKDQQGNNVPEQGDTTHVQLLLFFKIMAFLNKHGVEFQEPNNWPKDADGLPAKALGCINSLDKNIVVHGPDFARFFLTVCFRLYSDILNNRKAYEYFNTTYYTLLWPADPNSPRYIYHGSKEKKTFSNVLSSALGYVNDDHVSIAKQLILTTLDMQQFNGSLSALALKVSYELRKGILAYAESFGMGSSSSHSSDIDASNTHAVQLLLDSEAGQKQIIDSFSILIDKISNQHLNNNLNEEEKEQLNNSLSMFFIHFNYLLPNYYKSSNSKVVKLGKFINQLIATISNALVNTLTQQYQRLKKDETEIVKKLAILPPNKIINTNIQNVLFSLMYELSYDNESKPLNEERFMLLKSKLRHYINLSTNKTIDNHNKLIDAWSLFKKNRLQIERSLNIQIPHTNLENVTEEQLIILYQSEVEKTDPNIAIVACENLCQQLEDFKKLLTHLNRYRLKFNIPNIQIDLEKRQWYLMHKAVDFWNSINEGSPLLGQKNISQYLQDLNRIHASVTQIEQDNHQLTTISDLNQQLEEQKVKNSRNLSGVEHENYQLITKLTKLSNQLNKQREENIQLEQTILARNREISDSNKKLEQQQNTINELSNAINEEQEAELLLLIKQKLLPLTLTYEKHLNKLADSAGKNEKVVAIRKLKRCLTDKQINILPSQRVLAFYTKLQQSDTVIKKHSDQAWVRYLRNTVLVAGTILTGLLPGLLLLGLYSAFSSKQSLLFWKSHGEILSKEYHRYESMCPPQSH